MTDSEMDHLRAVDQFCGCSGSLSCQSMYTAPYFLLPAQRDELDMEGDTVGVGTRGRQLEGSIRDQLEGVNVQRRCESTGVCLKRPFCLKREP